MLEFSDIVNLVRDDDIHVFQLIMSRDLCARECFRHREYTISAFKSRVKPERDGVEVSDGQLRIPASLHLKIWR